MPTYRQGIKYHYLTPYETEDALFVDAIKALAAKVLTVVSSASMMERKTDVDEIYGVRSLIGGRGKLARMKYKAVPLGGGSDRDILHTTPDVVDAAIGFYFYIPAYMEFYHELFRTEDGVDKCISLINDFSSPFQKLLRYLFHRREVADYDEKDIKVIVHEVNHIYSHYAGKKDALRQVITDLVKEINSRYSLVDPNHVSKFNNTRYDMELKALEDSAREAGEMDGFVSSFLLPEEKEAFTSRDLDLVNAPSDTVGRDFLSSRQGSDQEELLKLQNKVEYPLDAEGRMKLHAFRKKIDEKFGRYLEDFSRDGFEEMNNTRDLVSQYSASLVGKTEKIDRLAVVSSLIRVSDDTITKNDLAGIVFLEMVKFPKMLIESVVDNLYKWVGSINDTPEHKQEPLAYITRTEMGDMDDSFDGLSADPVYIRRTRTRTEGTPVNIKKFLDDLVSIIDVGGFGTDLVKVTFSSTPGGRSSAVHVDVENLRQTLQLHLTQIKVFSEKLKGKIDEGAVTKIINETYSLEARMKTLLDNATISRGGTTRERPSLFSTAFERIDQNIRHVASGAEIISSGDESVILQLQSYPMGAELIEKLFIDLSVPHKFTATETIRDKLLDVVRQKEKSVEARSIDTIYPEDGYWEESVDMYKRYRVDFTEEDPSIFISVNKAVRELLDQFLDKTTSKIYETLVRRLSTGKLSACVGDPMRYSYPDIFEHLPTQIESTKDSEYNNNYLYFRLPREHSLLTFSNALVIRVLNNTVDIRTKMPTYLVQSRVDIPEHMREIYRTKIPMFQTMFGNILNRIEKLKDVVEKSIKGEDSFRYFSTYEFWSFITMQEDAPESFRTEEGEIIKNQNLYVNDMVYDYKYTASKEFNVQSYVISMLGNYKEVCTEILGLLSDVHKDVKEDPIYMQISPKFFSMYEKQYKRYPLVLLSLLEPYTDTKNIELFYDLSTVAGTNEFRIQTGVRGIFFGIDTIVDEKFLEGPLHWIKEYNSSTTEGNRVSVPDYVNNAKRSTQLLRVLHKTVRLSEKGKSSDDISGGYIGGTPEKAQALYLEKTGMGELLWKIFQTIPTQAPTGLTYTIDDAGTPKIFNQSDMAEAIYKALRGPKNGPSEVWWSYVKRVLRDLYINQTKDWNLGVLPLGDLSNPLPLEVELNSASPSPPPSLSPPIVSPTLSSSPPLPSPPTHNIQVHPPPRVPGGSLPPLKLHQLSWDRINRDLRRGGVLDREDKLLLTGTSAMPLDLPIIGGHVVKGYGLDNFIAVARDMGLFMGGEGIFRYMAARYNIKVVPVPWIPNQGDTTRNSYDRLKRISFQIAMDHVMRTHFDDRVIEYIAALAAELKHDPKQINNLGPAYTNDENLYIYHVIKNLEDFQDLEHVSEGVHNTLEELEDGLSKGRYQTFTKQRAQFVRFIISNRPDTERTMGECLKILDTEERTEDIIREVRQLMSVVLTTLDDEYPVAKTLPQPRERNLYSVLLWVGLAYRVNIGYLDQNTPRWESAILRRITPSQFWMLEEIYERVFKMNWVRFIPLPEGGRDMFKNSTEAEWAQPLRDYIEVKDTIIGRRDTRSDVIAKYEKMKKDGTWEKAEAVSRMLRHENIDGYIRKYIQDHTISHPLDVNIFPVDLQPWVTLLNQYIYNHNAPLNSKIVYMEDAWRFTVAELVLVRFVGKNIDWQKVPVQDLPKLLSETVRESEILERLSHQVSHYFGNFYERYMAYNQIFKNRRVYPEYGSQEYNIEKVPKYDLDRYPFLAPQETSFPQVDWEREYINAVETKMRNWSSRIVGLPDNLFEALKGRWDPLVYFHMSDILPMPFILALAAYSASMTNGGISGGTGTKAKIAVVDDALRLAMFRKGRTIKGGTTPEETEKLQDVVCKFLWKELSPVFGFMVKNPPYLKRHEGSCTTPENLYYEAIMYIQMCLRAANEVTKLPDELVRYYRSAMFYPNTGTGGADPNIEKEMRDLTDPAFLDNRQLTNISDMLEANWEILKDELLKFKKRLDSTINIGIEGGSPETEKMREELEAWRELLGEQKEKQEKLTQAIVDADVPLNELRDEPLFQEIANAYPDSKTTERAKIENYLDYRTNMEVPKDIPAGKIDDERAANQRKVEEITDLLRRYDELMKFWNEPYNERMAVFKKIGETEWHVERLITQINKAEALEEQEALEAQRKAQEDQDTLEAQRKAQEEQEALEAQRKAQEDQDAATAPQLPKTLNLNFTATQLQEEAQDDPTVPVAVDLDVLDAVNTTGELLVNSTQNLTEAVDMADPMAIGSAVQTVVGIAQAQVSNLMDANDMIEEVENNAPALPPQPESQPTTTTVVPAGNMVMENAVKTQAALQTLASALQTPGLDPNVVKVTQVQVDSLNKQIEDQKEKSIDLIHRATHPVVTFAQPSPSVSSSISQTQSTAPYQPTGFHVPAMSTLLNSQQPNPTHQVSAPPSSGLQVAVSRPPSVQSHHSSTSQGKNPPATMVPVKRNDKEKGTKISESPEAVLLSKQVEASIKMLMRINDPKSIYAKFCGESTPGRAPNGEHLPSTTDIVVSVYSILHGIICTHILEEIDKKDLVPHLKVMKEVNDAISQILKLTMFLHQAASAHHFRDENKTMMCEKIGRNILKLFGVLARHSGNTWNLLQKKSVNYTNFFAQRDEWDLYVRGVPYYKNNDDTSISVLMGTPMEESTNITDIRATNISLMPVIEENTSPHVSVPSHGSNKAEIFPAIGRMDPDDDIESNPYACYIGGSKDKLDFPHLRINPKSIVDVIGGVNYAKMRQGTNFRRWLTNPPTGSRDTVKYNVPWGMLVSIVPHNMMSYSVGGGVLETKKHACFIPNDSIVLDAAFSNIIKCMTLENPGPFTAPTNSRPIRINSKMFESFFNLPHTFYPAVARSFLSETGKINEVIQKIAKLEGVNIPVPGKRMIPPDQRRLVGFRGGSGGARQDLDIIFGHRRREPSQHMLISTTQSVYDSTGRLNVKNVRVRSLIMNAVQIYKKCSSTSEHRGRGAQYGRAKPPAKRNNPRGRVPRGRTSGGTTYEQAYELALAVADTSYGGKHQELKLDIELGGEAMEILTTQDILDGGDEVISILASIIYTIYKQQGKVIDIFTDTEIEIGNESHMVGDLMEIGVYFKPKSERVFYLDLTSEKNLIEYLTDPDTIYGIAEGSIKPDKIDTLDHGKHREPLMKIGQTLVSMMEGIQNTTLLSRNDDIYFYPSVAKTLTISLAHLSTLSSPISPSIVPWLGRLVSDYLATLSTDFQTEDMDINYDMARELSDMEGKQVSPYQHLIKRGTIPIIPPEGSELDYLEVPASLRYKIMSQNLVIERVLELRRVDDVLADKPRYINPSVKIRQRALPAPQIVQTAPQPQQVMTSNQPNVIPSVPSTSNQPNVIPSVPSASNQPNVMPSAMAQKEQVIVVDPAIDIANDLAKGVPLINLYVKILLLSSKSMSLLKRRYIDALSTQYEDLAAAHKLNGDSKLKDVNTTDLSIILGAEDTILYVDQKSGTIPTEGELLFNYLFDEHREHLFNLEWLYHAAAKCLPTAEHFKVTNARNNGDLTEEARNAAIAAAVKESEQPLADTPANLGKVLEQIKAEDKDKINQPITSLGYPFGKKCADVSLSEQFTEDEFTMLYNIITWNVVSNLHVLPKDDSLFTGAANAITVIFSTSLDKYKALRDKIMKAPPTPIVTGGSSLAAGIINILTSESPQERIGELVKGLRTKRPSKSTRVPFPPHIIQAIFETGIMPINVHAMQRFIPLSNIYNHSYNFDRMVENYYKEFDVGSTRTITYLDMLRDGGARTLRNSAISLSLPIAMQVQLLIHPLSGIDTVVYGCPLHSGIVAYSPVARLMRGSEDLGLGKARFISDQLMGKALLGSPYTGTDLVDKGVATMSLNILSENELPHRRPSRHGRSVPDTRSRKMEPAIGLGKLYENKMVATNMDDDDKILNTLYYSSNGEMNMIRISTHGIGGLFNERGLSKDSASFARYEASDWVIPLSPENRKEFHLEGYERFNTQIVRMSIFLANIQRFMRTLISDALLRSDKTIESSVRILDPEITELEVNNRSNMSAWL